MPPKAEIQGPKSAPGSPMDNAPAPVYGGMMGILFPLSPWVSYSGIRWNIRGSMWRTSTCFRRSIRLYRNAPKHLPRVFTNEVELGNAAIAAAAKKTDSPSAQGLVFMVKTFCSNHFCGHNHKIRQPVVSAGFLKRSYDGSKLSCNFSFILLRKLIIKNSHNYLKLR